MNLELLDPFGRQIPDRVDATLDCPTAAASASGATGGAENNNSANNSSSNSNNHIHHKPSAYIVSWNRRGTFIATGYSNGTVAMYSLLSRSLVALYSSVGDGGSAAAGTGTTTTSSSKNATVLRTGVSSISWTRRSRTILTGAAGDSTVQFLDLTHPYGPEGASLVSPNNNKPEDQDSKDVDGDDADDHAASTTTPKKKDTSATTTTTDKDNAVDGSVIAPPHRLAQTKDTAFVDTDDPDVQIVTERHVLAVRWVTTASANSKKNRRPPFVKQLSSTKNIPSRPRTGKRFPSLTWSFGDEALVGGSLQIHPTVDHAGLATLQDGRLVVFYTSPDVWYKDPAADGAVDETKQDEVHILELTDADSTYNVACAVFGPTGNEIYAATKDGFFLGWKGLDENTFWRALAEKAPAITTTPSFVATIPTKPAAWHIQVSRNGQYVVVNAADGILRLYKTAEVAKQGSSVQPASQFQDVVNRIKFSSCDFSGDGEHLVGGVNGKENRYELYIWSTATGMLVDTLAGAAVQLYAVAWHPNRALLAVATSDGLVDVWGPRINWTAFAPDFQALPRNVDYVEREDEFDLTKNGTYIASQADPAAAGTSGGMSNMLDVQTIGTVPAFASDSEDETEVFSFEPRVHSGTVKLSKNFTKVEKVDD